jgi:hypothetical protein
MNPLLAQALGGLLRTALQWVAAALVAKGVWTSAEAETYVAGAVLALLTYGWSLWVKHKGRLRLEKAMEMPAGVSEADVKAAVKLDRAS